MFVLEKDGRFDSCPFLVYDAHGNMVLTIARTGTSDTNPAYASSNRRAFDVWGSVRASDNLRIPTNKQRYCANLGHVEDDESGLIYMRARFYEPWTGRFVSEDRARDGWNWFTYCNNNPVDNVDFDGNEWDDDAYFIFGRVLNRLGKAFYAIGWVKFVAAVCVFYQLMVAARSIRDLPPGGVSLGGQSHTGLEIAKMENGLSFISAASFLGTGLLAQWIGNLYMALGSDANELLPGILDDVEKIFEVVREFAEGLDGGI